MTFETLIFVFLIVIFTLELILGSMILKAVDNLEIRILQMTEFICAIRRDLQEDNKSKLTREHKDVLVNKTDEHDFII